jgi:hypothetical protein
VTANRGAISGDLTWTIQNAVNLGIATTNRAITFCIHQVSVSAYELLVKHIYNDFDLVLRRSVWARKAHSGRESHEQDRASPTNGLSRRRVSLLQG